MENADLYPGQRIRLAQNIYLTYGNKGNFLIHIYDSSGRMTEAHNGPLEELVRTNLQDSIKSSLRKLK